MSPINSALQYKIQKMERQLSSLMEENVALRNIINEANLAAMSPTQAHNYGGGHALAQGLAMQPNIGVAGMASASRSTSPTSTSTASTSPTFRSAPAQAQTTGGGGYNGANLGALLATLAGVPGAEQIVANYLAQFGGPVATGALSVDGKRNTNNLSTRR